MPAQSSMDFLTQALAFVTAGRLSARSVPHQIFGGGIREKHH
jgi:hypothetical protein